MKNKLPVFTLLLLFAVNGIKAQDFYWVAFSDKSNTAYSLENPEEYLSERAIQRRKVQNILIDSLDLPVNQEYISQIIRPGVSLVHSSKWLNGITVKVEIDSFEQVALSFPFVTEVQLTKPALMVKSTVNKFDEPDAWRDNLPVDTSWYGPSVYQTGLLNGQYLHQLDYFGEGKQIAVLDGGFLNADIYPAFDSLWINNRILGNRDFVNDSSDFFQTNYHGMSVLSCMGGFVPGELIGTAPEASYWLIRSEEEGSEYIIEEDNWVAAAEFADSVGADIINSSLGYYEFDDTITNHTYADMDGKTTRVTRAANIAFSRGMLVINSAGNEGNTQWKYIIAPSDGDNVIGVGATNKFGFASNFTSYGPASDGDIKPNLSAVGWSTYLVNSNGNLGYSSGTSFSSPVLAGMIACLWQANPTASAQEIKDALEQSAHLYDSPDSLLGYGIPDMKIARQILDPTLVYNVTEQNRNENSNWQVAPNPFAGNFLIQNTGKIQNQTIHISIFSADGRLLLKEERETATQISLNNLQSLPPGLLILRIDSDTGSESVKLSKVR
ncbi:S8 family serine peptidase [Maribellus maritimus]|uniref:S8 family serine peptidase n=1 Tax=Maribellus maritimus TaxID=2870838 RepID=UPI001EEB989E|nr:S8 family serine peptidase [Maribellus maritimus]MCG6190417.1 S8 family serine peptidase [Maribellus maritimus]